MKNINLVYDLSLLFYGRKITRNIANQRKQKFPLQATRIQQLPPRTPGRISSPPKTSYSLLYHETSLSCSLRHGLGDSVEYREYFGLVWYSVTVGNILLTNPPHDSQRHFGNISIFEHYGVFLQLCWVRSLSKRVVLYGNEDYLVQQTIANGDTKGECMDMGWNISLF